MARLVLFHWHTGEAEERAGFLRAAGHGVRIHADQGADGLREITTDPPDAVVIDLRRLPAHGRTIGVMLRQRKALRHLPLVFVEGDPTKTDAVKALMPDAVFSSWRHIRGAVREALRSPPETPVVPGLMDSHKGTPLPRKLGLRTGDEVVLMGAPKNFVGVLGELPTDVVLRHRAGGHARVVLLFVKRTADLARRFPVAARTVVDGGRLWIVWPKKTSPLAGDLGMIEVRAFGLAREWVDFKVCKIDDDWSGLCFVRRKA